MASDPRQTLLRVDEDGVRVVKTPRSSKTAWLIGCAIGLPIVATIVAVVLIRLAPVESADAPAPPGGEGDAATVVREKRAVPGAPAAGLPKVERLTPRRIARPAPVAGRPAADAKPAAEGKPNETQPELNARDVIPALIEAGERGGIAAFPPPGTDPVKPGIIVPDDFALPEGFVRHYQSTDDGERLPAILMVHPDYELVNERGESVAAPGRIVPPEMAPPGLPIQMLEVPEPSAGAPDRAR